MGLLCMGFEGVKLLLVGRYMVFLCGDVVSGGYVSCGMGF